ncbi:uncharacterized protein [Musca autumnalis]|uniref:uncharacterized protein n=1 Tax=Musca autumnalis TaxID=221902 RepID=UPI003CF82186
MFIAKQFVIFSLLGCLCSLQASVVPRLNSVKTIDEPALKQLKVTPSKLAEEPVIKELKSVHKTKSGDTLYGYVCTVGQSKTDTVGCAGYDSVSWSSEQNVELTVSCDKSNIGRLIRYAEVEFVVATQNVGCYVSSGSIGTNHLEVKVTALGTTYFEYSSVFYID